MLEDPMVQSSALAHPVIACRYIECTWSFLLRLLSTDSHRPASKHQLGNIRRPNKETRNEPYFPSIETIDVCVLRREQIFSVVKPLYNCPCMTLRVRVRLSWLNRRLPKRRPKKRPLRSPRTKLPSRVFSFPPSPNSATSFRPNRSSK
jgi:hypothetical protein